MRLNIVIAVLALVVAPYSSAANLELEAYSWIMDINGDIANGFGPFQGTTVDLKDDLNYDEETILGATIVGGGETHQLGISFFQIDVSEDSTLQQRIRFDDQVFNAFTKISSEFDASFVRPFYRLNTGAERVRGGVIVGAQLFSIDSEISDQAGNRASGDVKGGAPVIGAFLRAHPVEFVTLQGSIVGASWDVGDVSMDFTDIELFFRFVFPQGFFGGAGYKHVAFNGEDDGELAEADVELSGPALYGGFEW